MACCTTVTQVREARWDPPEGIKELPEELTKTLHHLSSVLASWEDGWRLTSVMPILRMGWKEDTGYYRFLSRASAPGYGNGTWLWKRLSVIT